MTVWGRTYRIPWSFRYASVPRRRRVASAICGDVWSARLGRFAATSGRKSMRAFIRLSLAGMNREQCDGGFLLPATELHHWLKAAFSWFRSDQA
jgi:hypothetical protein